MSRARNATASVKRNRHFDLEEKVDELEQKLKEKIEVSSGFSDTVAQARMMEQTLKFFDVGGRGLLNYQDFFAAMTKFNFVGVQREIEELFNRYDEYATGYIDYKDFSKHLWGLGKSVKLDPVAKNIVEIIRNRIISIGGADGYHGLQRAIAR
jgi:cell division septum initiation protein DivIVA